MAEINLPFLRPSWAVRCSAGKSGVKEGVQHRMISALRTSSLRTRSYSPYSVLRIVNFVEYLLVLEEVLVEDGVEVPESEDD